MLVDFMTFTNKWGVEYPEAIRRYVKPGTIVDLSRQLKDVAVSVTGSTKTIDEAIIAVHTFMKNAFDMAKIPVTLSVPLQSASAAIGDAGKKEKLLSYNKAVIETALLRSVDIPARVGTYECDLSPAGDAILGKTARKLARIAGWYPSLHYATEVFVKDEGKFKLKDSWVPGSACKEFPGTCTADEAEEWARKHEIKGMQGHVPCTKIADDDDYSIPLATGINIMSILRNSMHVFDIIDPSG